MVKNKLPYLFLLCLLLLGHFLSPSHAATADLYTTRQNYLSAMTSYTSAMAQFERNKQIYNRTKTDANYQLALNWATQTYSARQAAMIYFNSYLAGLLSNYVTPSDAVAAANLTTKLDQSSQTFQSLSNSFTNTTTWYKADDDFAQAFGVLNETAYQSFAQIYWHELNAIQLEFASIYQKRNQRILETAATEVERQRRANILAETERALTNLKDKIATAKPKLATVNGRESYFTFRGELNTILAELSASLKTYAGLE